MNRLRIKLHHEVIAKCDKCKGPVAMRSGSHVQFAGAPWIGQRDGVPVANGRCPQCNERYSVSNFFVAS